MVGAFMLGSGFIHQILLAEIDKPLNFSNRAKSCLHYDIVTWSFFLSKAVMWNAVTFITENTSYLACVR